MTSCNTIIRTNGSFRREKMTPNWHRKIWLKLILLLWQPKDPGRSAIAQQSGGNSRQGKCFLSETKKILLLTCWHPLSVGPSYDQSLFFPLKLRVRSLVPVWLISPLLIACHLLLSKIFINEAKQRQRWRLCGDKHLCCWDSYWLRHSRGQK